MKSTNNIQKSQEKLARFEVLAKDYRLNLNIFSAGLLPSIPIYFQDTTVSRFTCMFIFVSIMIVIFSLQSGPYSELFEAIEHGRKQKRFKKQFKFLQKTIFGYKKTFFQAPLLFVLLAMTVLGYSGYLADLITLL